MSRENLDWLNNNTLIGFTNERGNAWHYRKGSDNHYPGAVPVGDVQKRLFNWEPLTAIQPCPCGCKKSLKVVSRSDNRHRMGYFTEGYQPHDYNEWLVRTVSTMLGDTLKIGSAGLLRQGAVAWVSIEMADSIMTAAGVAFRPHLLATTSFDGSIKTTYKRCCTFVVCDNTRNAALSEDGKEVKVKHTPNGAVDMAQARDTLDIIQDTSTEIEAEIQELSSITVTNKQWFQFLDEYTPIPVDGKPRAITMAIKKRDALTTMYQTDSRWAPWTGTALGVLQAVDTWTQHERAVRGDTAAVERNMLDLVLGNTAKSNRNVLSTLQAVLAG